MAQQKTKNWWLILVLSLLIALVGIWIMVKPAAGFLALTLYFAFTIMFSGFFNFFFALYNRKILDTWAWFLVLGILEIVISIPLFLHLQLSALALIIYVALWLTFKASMATVYSFELKKLGFKDWWLNLIGGILTIIFAFLMILNPIFGAISIVYLTGITLLLAGSFGAYLSFQLKKVEDLMS